MIFEIALDNVHGLCSNQNKDCELVNCCVWIWGPSLGSLTETALRPVALASGHSLEFVLVNSSSDRP